MKSLIFIVVSVFLFNYIIPFGDALQCYHCDMEMGRDCDKPEGNKALITNCSAELSETTCYIRTQMVENGVSKIQRGCGKVNPCIIDNAGSIPVANDTSKCTKCDTNLCNFEVNRNTGVSNFRVNLSSVLLSSFMYFCIKKLL